MKYLFGLATLGLGLVSVQAQFTAGRVVVLQCDGSLTNGNSGSLVEYLPATASQGSPTYSVALPNSGTTDDGSSIVFGANSAFNHGLSLSADHALVVIGAYANMISPGLGGNVDNLPTGSGGANRVIGTVKYDGTYARPISSSTSFSGQTFRDAASDGFGNFWGINGSSLIYFNTDTQVQTAAGRCIGIFNGNLYYTIAANVRGYSGTPTTAATSSIIITNHTTSATGFGIPANPVVGSRAYIGDVTAGVIERSDWNGSVWVWQYDIALPSSDKVQFMAVDYSGANPVIFSTTAGQNRLYATSDPGPGSGNATTVLLATAPAGKVFRGVAPAPTQPALPSWTVQPISTTNNYGATVTFGPVSAVGANPNGYTWKKGATTLTDGGNITGSTTTTLMIANITSGDAGTYYAIASNNGGSLSSTGAVLTLAGSCITVGLTNITKAAGQAAVFSVGQACPGSLSYEWKHGNDVLSNGPGPSGSSTVSGATTATLTVSGVQDGDAGDYSVTITDSDPNPSSSTATLTVIDPPGITDQPVSTSKAVGQTASFSVDATGGGLSYQWKKGATPLANGPSGNGSTISGAQSATLSITTVQLADAGSYSVTVTNIAGTTNSDSATLTVGQIPGITSPPVNVTNWVGSNASFSVSASGTGLSYAWKHNGTTLVNDGLHIFGADTATLTIVGIVTDDAVNYSATVTNTFGSASASATLTVITAGPKPNTVAGQIIYEPFDYPRGPFPAAGVYSWDHIVNIYNQVSGQPAFWAPASSGLSQAVRVNDLADYTSVTRAPPGLYPWPGIDCNSTNNWYWSSAANNNHLKFGGVDQTNGAAYFSCLFHVDQGSPLNQGSFDIIAGFSSGDSVTSGANIDTWNYKLCTQVDGSSGDGYYLGVFKGNGTIINASSVNGQWATGKHLTRGELHFIVGCYKFVSGGTSTNDDIVTLWIDPDRSTFGASEGNTPAPDAGGIVTNWFLNAAVTEFGMKGTVAPASKRIADLRIGKTWASVTKPYYPTLRMTTGSPDVTLAWPAKDSFNGYGYKLQTSGSVTNGWTDDANTPVLDGSGQTNVVTETPNAPQFWRLFYPPRSGAYGSY